MAEKPDDKSATAKTDKLPWALFIGTMLTELWLYGVAVYLREHWPDNTLALNDVADVAAGVCAPLAFLWLVVAVFLQKEELSLQREELEATRKAMEKQAQESEKLVKETEGTRAIAANTFSMQLDKEAEAHVNDYINLVAQQIRLRAKDITIQLNAQGSGSGVFGSFAGNEDVGQIFRQALQIAEGFPNNFNGESHPQSKVMFVAEMQELIDALKAITAEIDEKKWRLTTARAKTLQLKKLEGALVTLLEWAETK